ncbi:MAG: hypothetical protein OSJ68_03900 [Clostridia bacterium]|nr:hypothetical protein [Clostridia bacterium]
MKRYEMTLSIPPFILIIVWGNYVALCTIIPVIEETPSGFISVLLSATDIAVIKRINKI